MNKAVSCFIQGFKYYIIVLIQFLFDTFADFNFSIILLYPIVIKKHLKYLIYYNFLLKIHYITLANIKINLFCLATEI